MINRNKLPHQLTRFRQTHGQRLLSLQTKPELKRVEENKLQKTSQWSKSLQLFFSQAKKLLKEGNIKTITQGLQALSQQTKWAMHEIRGIRIRTGYFTLKLSERLIRDLDLTQDQNKTLQHLEKVRTRLFLILGSNLSNSQEFMLQKAWGKRIIKRKEIIKSKAKDSVESHCPKPTLVDELLQLESPLCRQKDKTFLILQKFWNELESHPKDFETFVERTQDQSQESQFNYELHRWKNQLKKIYDFYWQI